MNPDELRRQQQLKTLYESLNIHLWKVPGFRGVDVQEMGEMMKIGVNYYYPRVIVHLYFDLGFDFCMLLAEFLGMDKVDSGYSQPNIKWRPSFKGNISNVIENHRLLLKQHLEKGYATAHSEAETRQAPLPSSISFIHQSRAVLFEPQPLSFKIFLNMSTVNESNSRRPSPTRPYVLEISKLPYLNR